MFFHNVYHPLKGGRYGCLYVVINILALKIKMVKCYGIRLLWIATKRGEATKIDEYAPRNIPSIKARAKYFILSPPKKNIAAEDKTTLKVLLIDRTKVCITLL